MLVSSLVLATASPTFSMRGCGKAQQPRAARPSIREDRAVFTKNVIQKLRHRHARFIAKRTFLG
jgi:hypothetical protein